MGAKAVAAALREGVEAGAAPGFVAAWIAPGRAAEHIAFGARGAEDASPMTTDTVFWIASLTKAITTAGVLQLVDRGVLALDEPVGARLPAFAEPRVLTGFGADGAPVARPARTQIVLRHLLGHNSGLAYDFCNADLVRYRDAKGVTLAETQETDTPLVFDPGDGWCYGIGLDWAGRLIEQATGETLAAYLATNLFDPLGMADTTFFPSASQVARRAGVHARQADGSVAPIAFNLPDKPYFGMGGGGLHATAPDYLKFLAMILAGGQAGGAPVLGPDSLTAMTTASQFGRHVGVLKTTQANLSNDFDPFPGAEKGWGLGFVINREQGRHGRSAGSLAWGGLANCYYWADPRRGVAGVMLAQVLPFADPRVLEVFGTFERAVYRQVDASR